MGGSMTYQRFRARNGLMCRAQDPSQPYNVTLPNVPHNEYGMIGDLNRMEWGYTDPESIYAYAADEVAEATEVDVETVRKVLRYVFFDQR